MGNCLWTPFQVVYFRQQRRVTMLIARQMQCISLQTNFWMQKILSGNYFFVSVRANRYLDDASWCRRMLLQLCKAQVQLTWGRNVGSELLFRYASSWFIRWWPEKESTDIPSQALERLGNLFDSAFSNSYIQRQSIVYVLPFLSLHFCFLSGSVSSPVIKNEFVE